MKRLSEEIKTLDDIGFIGNPRCKYTETDAKMMGDYFRQLRSFRKELLREPTEIEHRQIIKSVQNAYSQE